MQSSDTLAVFFISPSFHRYGAWHSSFQRYTEVMDSRGIVILLVFCVLIAALRDFRKCAAPIGSQLLSKIDQIDLSALRL